MAYYIQTPRGYAEFADDVPEDVARRQLFDEHPDFFPEEARRYYGQQDIHGETTALGRGFTAGWERATGNVGALWDYATGGSFEDFEKQLAAVDQAANKLNPYPTTFDDVARAYEIEGTVAGLNQFSAYVGELLGGSAPYAGAAIAGGAAGTLIAPGPGTVAGAVAPFAGASAASLPLFISDNVARQVEEGAKSDEDIDWLAAVGAGAGQSALNAAGPVLSGVFGRTAQTAFISQLLDKAARVPGGRYAAAGVGSAAVESFTEAGQTALERAQAGLDPFDDEEIRDAMIGGGVLGLLLGPVGASRSRPRGADGADPQVIENPSENTATAPESPETQFDPLQQIADQPLGLPAPEARPRGRIFEPAPEPDPEIQAEPIETESIDQLAREALKRTRQAETRSLLDAARETVTPIGTFDIQEVGPDLAGKVNIKRVQRGQAALDTFTMEDLAPVATRNEIDALIGARRPATAGNQITTPQEVSRAAQRKNIIPTDDNFKTFALRTTGQSNPERMSQTQLRVLIDKLNEMPVNDAPVTLPIVDTLLFTEKQYGDAVTAIRDNGRFSVDIVKEATGVSDKKTLNSIRDAMVRRGQIVQKGKNDYRLYDVIGTERRPTVDDLPEAASTSHVVREMAVSKVRLRKDGKSIGTFDSQTAAQAEVSKIREREAAKGGKHSELQIEPADDIGYGVVENRYDPEGNLIGKAVVDSYRDPEAAARAADALNRNEETDVPSPPTPRKPPAPEVIRGRMGEVMEGLRKQAKDRGLPLIDTRVRLTSEIKGPEGVELEAEFDPMSRIISVAVANLDPNMSTAELTEHLAQVVDHELIHALHTAGVLGPETDGWKTLDKYVRRAKRADTGQTYYQFAENEYGGLPGYDTEADFVEEAIAEAFRTWASDKRSVGGKPATVFRQLVEFFKRLLNAVPTDLFEAIESGRLVEESIAAPGADTARAKNVNKMEAIKTEIDTLSKASTSAAGPSERNIMGQRVKDLRKQFVDTQAQSRENRRGKSIPKTVMGFTPSPGFFKGKLGSTGEARAVAQKYRESIGNQSVPLPVYLPENLDYLGTIAEIHEKARHQPNATAVRKAYSALKSDVMSMFRNLGDITIVDWREGTEPYTTPAEVQSDIVGSSQIKLRLSNDMFGPSPETANHPMNEPSGVKTDTGRDVTYNDLFRVVNDFYGHGQAGFRYGPRDDYNAFHEMARIVSSEAQPALAAETLGPNAWQNYGKHMRRDDGTIPQFGDIDYLPQPYREFATDKAYVINPEILAKDPGLKIIEEAESASNVEFGELQSTEAPRRFSIKGKKNLRLEEIGSPRNRPYQYLFAITDPDDVIVGEVLVEREFAAPRHIEKARQQNNEDIQLGDPIIDIKWAGSSMSIIEEELTGYAKRLGPQVKEGEISQADMRNLASWLAERFPDTKYFYGSRHSGVRARAADTTRADGAAAWKYAQVVPTEPVRNRLETRMPGGKKYGKTNMSPGSEFVLPSTPAANFSASYDGNKRFAGSMVEAQIGMVRTNEDGAVLVYYSPDEFLDAAPDTKSPRQDEYNDLLSRGMKFNTLPSLVISKNVDVPTITGADGVHRVRALKAAGIQSVPVIIYPKNANMVDLITGIQGRSGPVRMPIIAENFPILRGAKPRYSIKARFGDRVPHTDYQADEHNIVFQRSEGMMKKLAELGRSKKELPFKIPLLSAKDFEVRTVMDARIRLQDKMLSVKDWLEGIHQKGNKITDAMNVYVREQLYHGRVVNLIEQRYEDLWRPILQAVKDNKNITQTDLEEYLYARHAPERNAHLRAAGSPEENPSGMSDEEAQTIMDNFASEGKIGDLQALAVMVDNVVADTTRTRIEYGLLSQEAADRSPYQHYVPLRGFAEEDPDIDSDNDQAIRARIGRGFSIGGKEDRSAFGRKRKAGEILGTLFLQNEEAIIRAEKNRVAVSLVEAAEANPGMGVTIRNVAPTRLVRMPNGQIRSAGDPSYRQRPDIVTAKVGGREIVMQVDDARIARAIKGVGPSSSNALISAMTVMNRYLAFVNTAINPEFLFSNLPRDAVTAKILGDQYNIDHFQKNLIRQIPKAMLGIREVLRDGTANSEWAKLFRELQRVGGTTEFLGIRDLERQLKNIQRELNSEGAGTPQRALKAIGKIGKFIEDYNKVAENGARLSAYANALRGGVSQEQAAYIAKNITVNFNKGGELKTAMNAMYLFYNVGIQGSIVILNGLRSKKVQKAVAGLMVVGLLQDMLNRALSGDADENGIADYDEIPDYVLENNFVLMDPMGLLKNVAGIERGYIAFPMPYGFNAFHNTGRNFSAVLNGKDPGKAVSSVLSVAVNSFNPIGGTESFLNFMSPTIGDPFFEIARNKDFADRDIVPDRPTFGVPTPESQKYWNSTGEPFKWVSEQLNELTGGNTIRSGVIDWSPEVLEHFYDYVLGAAGTFAKRTLTFGTDTVPSAIKGDFEDIEIGQIPFVRRVIGNVTDRSNTEAYYENSLEVMTVAEELKQAGAVGNGQEIQRLLAEHPREVALIETFEQADKNLQDLRRQLRETRENEHIPADQRQELEKTLRDQMDEIMRQMNRIYATMR